MLASFLTILASNFITFSASMFSSVFLMILHGFGRSRGAQSSASAPEVAPSFDDAGWELIDVPHDMLIGGTFSSKGDGLEMAHLPRGDGWCKHGF